MTKRRKSARRPTEPLPPDDAPRIQAAVDQAAAPAPDAPAELAAAQQETAEQFADVPPPPPPPPPAGEPRVEEDDAGAGVEDLAEELEHIDVAADLSEEEIAEFFELVFALIAEKRGKHWELPDRSAARLGRWGHRVLERHPELLAWLAKNLPELVFGVLLAVEIGQRYAEDRRLKPAPKEIVV
jgi:hypothetical protein